MRVISAVPLPNRFICAGSDTVKVVTERIPYLLKDCQNLPFNESLYVLHESLVGYMNISRFEKCFSVVDDMIGFTPNGQVKVWLNPNFADNYPTA